MQSLRVLPWTHTTVIQMCYWNKCDVYFPLYDYWIKFWSMKAACSAWSTVWWLMSISNPSWHLLAASNIKLKKKKKGSPIDLLPSAAFRLRIHNCMEQKPCIVPNQKLAEGTLVMRSVSNLPWMWLWVKVQSLAVALCTSPVKAPPPALCQCLTRQLK